MFHLCSQLAGGSKFEPPCEYSFNFIHHGRFYFKSFKILFSCLFAAYCNPSPAISQLWYEPCEQIIRVSGYNSFHSSFHVIQSDYIALFHGILFISTKAKHGLPSPFDFVYFYHPMQADAFANKLGYSSSLRAGLVRLQVTFQNPCFAYNTIVILV